MSKVKLFFVTTALLLLTVLSGGCLRTGGYYGGHHDGFYGGGYHRGYYSSPYGLSSYRRYDHINRKSVVAGWSSRCGAYRHSREYVSTRDTQIRRK
jgi:hypothetical protein